jgi:hypothetical protein
MTALSAGALQGAFCSLDSDQRAHEFDCCSNGSCVSIGHFEHDSEPCPENYVLSEFAFVLGMVTKSTDRALLPDQPKSAKRAQSVISIT